MAGIGTRLLTLTIDGDEVTAEVSKAVITSNDAGSDFTTFADAAAGGAREYRLEFTAVQDAVAGSLWDKVWTATGSDVPFILAPYGGTPSTSAPAFEGNVTITEPDGDFIGGEADSSTSARQTFSVAWVCDARPTRVTA
jgi:hypothetical protein